MEPYELTDGVVFLSAPTHDDIDTITELVQDPPVRAWTTMPSPYHREHAVGFIETIVADGWAKETELTWAIRLSRKGDVVGMVGIGLGPNGEIGFWIGPAYRDTGYVTRAARLAIEAAFNRHDLDHIAWSAIVGNLASRRVAWNLGFTFTGTSPRRLSQRGEWKDGWTAVLMREDPLKPRRPWLLVPTLQSAAGADGSSPAVRLRQARESDAAAIAQACSDPTTAYWLPFLPSPYTETDGLAYVHQRWESASDSKAISWVIDLDERAAVGAVSVFPASGPNDGLLLRGKLGGASGEVGYWLHPEVRGRGVARTAVGLALEHCFKSPDDGGLGLRRVMLGHAAGNPASGAVAAATGFSQCGRETRGEVVGDGEFDDLIWWERLPD